MRRCVLLALLSLVSCSQMLEDDGFDLWCGDELCSWRLEAGSVERVSTWHDEDYGLALIGDPVVLSQLRDDTSDDYGCVHFETLTSFDEGARLFVELDLDDDGTIDAMHEIPAGSWSTAEFDVPLGGTFQQVSFRVRKQGAGDAVIAQVRAWAGC